jgi:sugar/nucleoside kinase (ribokinase family)
VYGAVGARIWGASVSVVSVVGRDYPDEWLKQLRAAGVNVEAVRRLKVRHKLVAPMVYDEEGRRQNEREPSGFPSPMSKLARARRWNTFSPASHDATTLVGWPDAVHVAGMPIQRQNAFLRFFYGRVASITLDLPWPPQLYRAGMLPRVDLTSAVLLSEAEMKGIFPGKSVNEVGEELLTRGAQIVAIKRGARGSVVFHPGCRSGRYVPVFPTTVVDPTGAGDAYCGGFLVGLAETGSAEIAAEFGTISASVVIEGFGAAHGLGYSRKDAAQRLTQLRSSLTL